MALSKYVATKLSKNKFKSPEAKVRYDKVFSEKCFIPDKGFHPACSNEKQGIPTLSQVVIALKWVKIL